MLGCLCVGDSFAQEPPNHKGHFGAVFCAAFSPDGTKIVTAGYDNTARIWDAKTGTEVRRLKGDAGRIYSVAFSADGRKVVAANRDNPTVLIWDADSGEVLQKFEGHGRVTFSHDGKKVITIEKITTTGNVTAMTAHGRIVRIWDVESGKELCRFESEYRNGIYSIAFSPDGKKIFTVCYGDIHFDGTNTIIPPGIARMWDAESGKELQKFEVKHELCSSTIFSPDGKTIVTAGCRDGTVRIWDIESGKILQKFEHKPGINSAAFSSDGKKIVTAEDDTVRIWDIESGKELKKWTWSIHYWRN